MSARTAQTAMLVVGILACLLAAVALALGITAIVSGGSAVTSFLLAAVLAILGIADLVVVIRMRRRRPL